MFDTKVFLCSVLNFSSHFVDFVTSRLKGLDSLLTSSTVFVRPLEELLQIVADVIDRVQVEKAIGAKNCLFSMLCKNVRQKWK